MTGVLIKRENLDTDTQGQHNVKMKTEIRVMQKPGNTKDCQQATRSWERGTRQILPHSSQKKPTLLDT